MAERVSTANRLASALARAIKGRPAPAAALAGAPPPPSALRRTSFARHEVSWRPLTPTLIRRTLNVWLEDANSQLWVADAVALGLRLARGTRYAAVLSSGPPHFQHEAARRLSVATGAPLVMDMRDPWSLQQRLIAHVASPLWIEHARRREARCVARAALVVANTAAAAEGLAGVYPQARDRIETVMNGWDGAPLPWRRAPRFSIRYAGAIYLDRNPETLFQGLRLATEHLGVPPGDLTVEFMGAVESLDGTSLGAIAARVGVADQVRLHPPGTRAEAAAFVEGAAMLVSLPQDSDLAIPSKVFEYMRYPVRLLVLAEAASATGRVMRETSAEVVAPGDVAGIAAAIVRAHAEWRAGTPVEAIAASGRFSREGEGQKLFRRLTAIVRPG